MREFPNLEEAKRWVLVHGGGRRVTVIVGQSVYCLEVKDPTADLRRIVKREERSTRLWKILGWSVAAAWVFVVLWMAASCKA